MKTQMRYAGLSALVLFTGATVFAQSNSGSPGNSGNAGAMGNRPDGADPAVVTTIGTTTTSTVTTPPTTPPTVGGGTTMAGGTMSGSTVTTTTGTTTTVTPKPGTTTTTPPAGTSAGGTTGTTPVTTTMPGAGGPPMTPPGLSRPTPTVNENASDNAKAVQTLLNAFDAKRDAFIADRQKLVDQLAAAKTDDERAKILADMKKEQELRQEEQRDLAKEIRGQLKSLREQRKNGGG